MANTELEKRKPTAAGTVSPAEEPSVEWGWHGSFPKGTLIAGVFVGLAMFAMIIGNHTGLTADIWLIGIGAGLLAGIGWKIHKNRTSWRR
ncbi:DUF2631 domain-containing protein [Actinokineospora sp. NBRC 105648]|uniref:DUF2631 domain-containing protein n=1 Tax=Actinokineospora sp. NBRC 105648 TaxID=3032206 RepID=UPI0024A2E183|nr:DUF2631 domain-containing protein [Actinokineospora sp. NBRC 105648]GLZ41460.1 hypothetical protein Acsp05_50840 [Actinokineospora sp. NBRC 105648]